jgi:hypothetical protein
MPGAKHHGLGARVRTFTGAGDLRKRAKKAEQLAADYGKPLNRLVAIRPDTSTPSITLGKKNWGRKRDPKFRERMLAYRLVRNFRRLVRNFRAQPAMPPFALRNATRSLGAMPCL